MIEIKKTYKNYVDGKYVRSESGKTYSVKLGNEHFELPLTSRKDIRDAVVSSKSGFKKWNSTSPYTRTQILYRLSEMLEGNRKSYLSILQNSSFTKKYAEKDFENSIQKIIWFAGLADKWEQLVGNLNPVSGEYFNISHQNPIGVVFSLNKNTISLSQLILSILPPLTVGCSVISLSNDSGLLALKFAEDINNSDLPPGVLNILSGDFTKLIDDVSKHVEISLVSIHDNLSQEAIKKIEVNASESVKRVKINPSTEGISSILPYLETKTVWHPKGT
ncbi:MAG: aldehyde dehydrogenase family protein [Actinomycetota bacterium]|nr:aldehyde dehydrogenase family protein [Actinomycetota bacterium]MDA3013559.1 aldehyde dehydrogenase family protein [Actinomycetota bacterium]